MSTRADLPFVPLLERARAGDADGIEAPVERFYGRVSRTVHHRLALDLRVGRPWLASRLSTGDIVAEVFAAQAQLALELEDLSDGAVAG